MSEEERMMLAFVAAMLVKVESGLSLTCNEIQSLDNIADELGYNEIDEKHFRW